MDLTKGHFEYFDVEFLPKNEKFNNKNAFIVHKKVIEIWTYTRNETGFIEVIQPMSEDCFYRRVPDN